MGKKGKVGKQRRDKYYHLAKETGYRSRAAFKLIQLNKRFDFLQKSRTLVDLCAAPGGWLQVATQNMPLSSLRIGVDLVPIKPINQCITLQGDITTEKTRQMIKKELRGWEADCVLHDGAPNVGRNWIQDAFQQNCLTLSALKLATQILVKDGIFVTKIFRSSDYHHLISVFEKLFKQVHVWKPAASRLESAEIFVVCEKYQKPGKLDPDLLDPKKVFAESAQQSITANQQLFLQSQKKAKKQQAVGYVSDTILLHKTVNATDFIRSTDYLNLLGSANKIVLDDENWENDELTTDEVKCCLEDIKVCGPKELRLILQWRRNLLKKISAKEAQECDNTGKDVATLADPEEERMAEIERQLVVARTVEKAALKRKKRKLLKEKADLEKRKKLKMVLEGDVYEVPEEQELFSLKKIAKIKSRGKAANTAKNDAIESDSSVSDADVDDLSDDSYLEHDPNALKFEEVDARKIEWFERNKITELVDDEEDALRTVENFMRKSDIAAETNKNKNEMESVAELGFDKQRTSIFKDENESEEEYKDVDEKTNKSLSLAGTVKEGKLQKLSPELLALGEQLIYSSKTRRDVEDWGWNRYTNNDEGLPDWFVEDEKKHFRKELPVSKDRVEFYKNRLRDIGMRTIKKVAEAKARKKRRRDLKLRIARKRAEGILESENMEQAEKAREVRKLYRMAAASIKKTKKVTYAVMTKGSRGRLTRPKGPYKVVDARLKKDNRRQKQANKNKRRKVGNRRGKR